jgi:hypothetical protein
MATAKQLIQNDVSDYSGQKNLVIVFIPDQNTSDIESVKPPDRVMAIPYMMVRDAIKKSRSSNGMAYVWPSNGEWMMGDSKPDLGSKQDLVVEFEKGVITSHYVFMTV